MSADELREALDLALAELRTEQSRQAAEWCALYVDIGRAIEALSLGDPVAARAALVSAEAGEYSLSGSADSIGRVVEALDGGALKEDPS